MEMDPMWEVVSSVQLLQHGGGRAYFDRWRRQVREVAARSNHVRAAVGALAEVAPHAAYFPDFLTPAMDVPDLDTGIDVVLSTSRARLAEEIGWLRRAARSSAWLDDMGRGDIGALRQLRWALRVYAREVIEAHLPVVEEALRAERAELIHTYLQHGPDGLLAGFEPLMRWEPPVLTVWDYPVERDLHLGGRGLLLVPCYFALCHPVALADPAMRPVLVLPLRPESRLHRERRGDLNALLGHTRAAILHSTVTGSTTSALAQRNNVTPATVSHHIGILRNTGLISTHQRAHRVTHLITPLGLRLLNENPLVASHRIDKTATK